MLGAKAACPNILYYVYGMYDMYMISIWACVCVRQGWYLFFPLCQDIYIELVAHDQQRLNSTVFLDCNGQPGRIEGGLHWQNRTSDQPHHTTKYHTHTMKSSND